MQWLNYHHLYYFRSIANEGSIAKAAKKLSLGQPALSTQLKRLEDSLGVALFERKNRSLVLTEAGRVALEYANEIFRIGDEMVEALQDRLVSQQRVHVQIGALDSVPKHIISSLVESAYRTANCMVSILEGKGDELFRELMAYRIDLVLSNYPPPLGEESGIYARSIAKLPVLVCGASKFASLKKDFPKSLAGKPFVLPTRHSKLRHDLEHFFKVNEISVDSVGETQDTSVQQLLAIAGVGLAPLVEPVARGLIAEKKLINLGQLKSVHEDIWLVSATRRIENPVAAKLMKAFELR